MQGEELACFPVWVHTFMNVCVCAQCLPCLTRAQQKDNKKAFLLIGYNLQWQRAKVKEG